MGPVSATAAIDAPRERVYGLLADLALRPAFTDHFIDEFRLERLESAGIGAAARFQIPSRGIWVESVITESSPPHLLLEEGGGGRLDHLPVQTAWALVNAAAGCEVTVTFVIDTAEDRFADLAAKARGTEGWYRRQWSRALRRLRDLAESDASPPRVIVAGADRLGV
jgi:uncharacterized protein YndB with AHSA1/START domain